MRKNKKYLIMLGSLATVVAPLIAAISCGSSSSGNETGNEKRPSVDNGKTQIDTKPWTDIQAINTTWDELNFRQILPDVNSYASPLYNTYFATNRHKEYTLNSKEVQDVNTRFDIVSDLWPKGYKFNMFQNTTDVPNFVKALEDQYQAGTAYKSNIYAMNFFEKNWGDLHGGVSYITDTIPQGFKLNYLQTNIDYPTSAAFEWDSDATSTTPESIVPSGIYHDQKTFKAGELILKNAIVSKDADTIDANKFYSYPVGKPLHLACKSAKDTNGQIKAFKVNISHDQTIMSVEILGHEIYNNYLDQPVTPSNESIVPNVGTTLVQPTDIDAWCDWTFKNVKSGYVKTFDCFEVEKFIWKKESANKISYTAIPLPQNPYYSSSRWLPTISFTKGMHFQSNADLYQGKYGQSTFDFTKKGEKSSNPSWD